MGKPRYILAGEENTVTSSINSQALPNSNQVIDE